MGQFFRVFVFLWPIILFYLSHLTRPSPDLFVHLLAKLDSKVEHDGKVIQTYYGLAPPPFLTQRGLSACGWGLPDLEDGGVSDLFVPLSKQGSAPLFDPVVTIV